MRFGQSIALGLAFLSACGGDDMPGDSPDASADSAGHDGDGVTDDAEVADGDTTPIEPPPEGVLRTSYISATSYDYGEVESGLAVAGFYDQDPAPATRSVTD